MLVKVGAAARGLWEEGSRFRPGAGIGVPRRDVVRDLASGKVPDLDAVLVPKVCEDSSTSAIESMAVAARIRVLDPASCVAFVASDIAVRLENLAFHIGTILSRAAFSGMEGVLIHGHVVNAFQDIDFTALGPFRSDGPKAGVRPVD